MRIPRISRPGAIYDASAAEQIFPGRKIIATLEGNWDISENEEKEYPQKESKNNSDHIHGFTKILQCKQSDVNKVRLLKKTRGNVDKSRILRYRILFSEKGSPAIKGG